MCSGYTKCMREVKATFLAVRAIGSRFGVQLWNQVAIIAGIVLVLVSALLAWLVSMSAWWWLLAVPCGIVFSVVIAVFVVFRLLLNYVNTAHKPAQKQVTKAFVEKVQFVQEFIGTPKFVILFRVVRSVAAPSSEKYLENVFESRKLKKDFEKVVEEFRA